MIATLVVIGSIVAYFAVGCLYARSKALVCYRRAKSEWLSEDIVRESVLAQMAWRVPCWPYAVVFDALRDGFRNWMIGPITVHQRRISQLRADAAAWREKRDSGTLVERQMALELVKLCEDQANELEGR